MASNPGVGRYSGQTVLPGHGGSHWRTLLTVLLGALLCGPGPATVASAEALQVVEGIGVILQENQALARDRAIQDALRKAVEQSIAAALEPSAPVERLQALQARLTARTLQYIRSYRVLWEYPDVGQKVYRVGMEVEVASEVVQIAKGTPRPRQDTAGVILVRMAENQSAPTGLGTAGQAGSAAAEEIGTQLQAWGYRVVASGTEVAWDGQESSALTAARDAGAGVVLVGLVEVRQLRNEATAALIQATTQARLVATRTRTQLAQERGQTTVAHTDASLGAQQALKQAATVLVARLVPSLQAYQQQVREQQLYEQQLREQQVREQPASEQQIREPANPAQNEQ
jgi:hypothetical protein